MISVQHIGARSHVQEKPGDGQASYMIIIETNEHRGRGKGEVRSSLFVSLAGDLGISTEIELQGHYNKTDIFRMGNKHYLF